jgi:DNA cross-link repair 1C protein
MSTFDGLISEFPDIRVDFFRRHPKHRPPLACFLSHVHSDHLAGLESFKSPFIYCSPATKQMLPCLEKYPCRLNYAKGILEARKQTYKHLRNLLKPLPLNTPTTLELRPQEFMCVTLLDSNHCPGAVMFLFERPGVAALYTGDIRCEPWFINSLVRNPAIIEYTQGLKTLDKIYLDTSFVDDVDFQTKADGLRELLRKVARYPRDTIFFFHAWTYG